MCSDNGQCANQQKIKINKNGGGKRERVISSKILQWGKKKDFCLNPFFLSQKKAFIG